jgi:hypothetical protein
MGITEITKLSLVILILSNALAFGALAHDKHQHAMDPKMDEMMKKMQAAATPGEQHKMLADMTGSWNCESKMWHAKDSEPQESKGKSVFKMILGGRWLQQDFKGMAMGQKH